MSHKLPFFGRRTLFLFCEVCILKCHRIVISWGGLNAGPEPRQSCGVRNSSAWLHKTQTAHLKMAAPNKRTATEVNPLTPMSSPCLARLLWKPRVKNAFGVADAAGQTVLGMHAMRASRLACVVGNPGKMPLLYASSPPLPLHLHNLHKQREGRGSGGWGWGVTSYRKLTSNCVWPCGETNMAVWGELLPQRALMTTRWDAPTTCW